MINHRNLYSHIKMGNQILTFEYIKIGKKILAMKFLFFKKDVDIEKVLVSNMISLVQKIVNTLLVTCIIIIKLNHFI